MPLVIAQVVLDHTTNAYDQPFDYLVPEQLNETCLPGCRVQVPFGRGNTCRQGIVLSCRPYETGRTLKSIERVVDPAPILSDEMLQLAGWMREHTFCTYYDAVSAMLPAGLSLRIKTYFRLVHRPDILPDGDAGALIDLLDRSGGKMECEKLCASLSLSQNAPLFERLVRDGIIERTESAERRMGDATQKMVRISPDFDGTSIKLTPKQRAVVDLLSEIGACSVKEVLYFTGVTSAVISALAKKGAVEFYEQEVFRAVCPQGINRSTDETQICLTPEQQRAYETLLDRLKAGRGESALLYGVTGSGKTQVFLKLADAVVAEGRGVIVMVPEIALTPQTLSIFYRRYGDNVAVFHSAMALGQRMDEWKRVKTGRAKIAVGTRSAIFAPFAELGLIIMDEEQEHTYKSERSPRYHARDLAKFRARYHRALFLMASATPSVETYSAAKAGHATLCTLTERYGGAHLPEVVTVDMRKELLAGNTGAISRELAGRLEDTLQQGNQAILLLNRRGHNTYISCPSCGFVATCPNCSISMTYHSANGRLICHYCGHSETYTKTCPKCGAEHLRYYGTGTQKAEEELARLFPNARVVRLDADSTMTRNSFSDALSAFQKGEADILLGTQMVAKGLDFPKVTLVGVLAADGAMYSDDFRSYERTFSLLTQVIGRSGRGKAEGVALIQTANPNSDIIRLSALQDYDAFYKTEILTRKLMIYPPYCEIVLACVTADRYDIAATAANALFDAIKALVAGEYRDVKLIILGPSPATVPKVGGRYRFRLIIKCHNNQRFRDLMRAAMRQSEHKDASVFLDVNPETIL